MHDMAALYLQRCALPSPALPAPYGPWHAKPVQILLPMHLPKSDLQPKQSKPVIFMPEARLTGKYKLLTSVGQSLLAAAMWTEGSSAYGC